MGPDPRSALKFARDLQVVVGDASPAPSVPIENTMATLDAIVVEPQLRATARQLFVDGHYSRAVEEGFKLLNNVVKRRSGLSSDGASLMTSAMTPNGSVLKMSVSGRSP